MWRRMVFRSSSDDVVELDEEVVCVCNCKWLEARMLRDCDNTDC